MRKIQVAVLNECTALSVEEVQRTVHALQTQVSRDFAPVWGIDTELNFYPWGNPPPQAWQLAILENSDQAGALGYHDVTLAGLPLGKVFAGAAVAAGNSWTVLASQELLAMLVDPEINHAVFAEDKNGGGLLYAVENCGACGKEEFGYLIDGVQVADFVYPSWFESYHPAGSRYDHSKKITQPFQVLPGGSALVYHIHSGQGWQELRNAHEQQGAAGFVRTGTRGERRKLPRKQWKASKLHKGSGAAGADESILAGSSTVAEAAAELAPGPAHVTITFFSGGIADNLTVTFNRQIGGDISKAVDFNGGTLSFDSVSSNDLITIDGLCLGTATVGFDIPLNNNPLPSYPAGNILDFFTVK